MRTPIRYYRHRRQRKVMRFTESAAHYLDATLKNPTRDGVPTSSFPDWDELDDRMDLRHSSGFGKTTRLSVYQSFNGLLMNFMRKKNRSVTVLCRTAKIPRAALAEILSDPSYRPTRHEVMLLSLALHLKMREAEQLMAAAGHAFSHDNPQDILVEFCLRVHQYRIDRVNELLLRLNVPPIPRSFYHETTGGTSHA